MNWFRHSHPEAHFINNLVVIRIGGDRRITICDRKQTFRAGDGRSDRRKIATPKELLEILARHFAGRFPPGTHWESPVRLGGREQPRAAGFRASLARAAVLVSEAVVNDITVILGQIGRGDARAGDQLLPLVYEELRRLASAKMARESAAQTLQPTALVHEAWLRLGGDAQPGWQNRAHFFAAAAEAMRRILIDRARRRHAQRHGGDQERLNIDDLQLAVTVDDDALLAINEALEKLAAHDAPKAELVKLRYFVGLTTEEAAQALGIAEPTAKRWWAYSRAWLYQEIKKG